MRLPQPPILFITDRTLTRRSVDSVVADALAGGCRWVMVREKDLSEEELSAVVSKVVEMARPYRATVMVNSNAAVARSCGAGGVHLPSGRSALTARGVVGRDALIGVSAHSLDEARQAAGEGADYVTISPIFQSVSKPEYGVPLGLDALRRFVSEAPLPVIALGGITPRNMPGCLGAGAAGVAVLGTIMLSEDPRAATEGYVRLLKPAT